MNQYRFFFGTLMRGMTLYKHFNLANNKNFKFIQTVELSGYDMFNVGYPIIKPGTGKIYGELVQITDKKLLEKLDYACVIDDFEICKKTIKLGIGHPKTAQTYIYTGHISVFPKIEGGRYNGPAK